MWPWRHPFHASPAVRKGPISSKSISSQDPFGENFEILASTASIFTQILALKPPNMEIFSSQALKLEIFSSQAPKIWKFSAHKPPFQRQVSVRKPLTSEIRATHPYLKKKLSAPPPPRVFPLWGANAYWNTFQKPLVTHGVHTGTWVIPAPPLPPRNSPHSFQWHFSFLYSFPEGMHVWIFRVVTWLCLSCGWSTGYGYIRPNWSGENNSMRFWPPTWAKKFSCSS